MAGIDFRDVYRFWGPAKSLEITQLILKVNFKVPTHKIVTTIPSHCEPGHGLGMPQCTVHTSRSMSS